MRRCSTATARVATMPALPPPPVGKVDRAVPDALAPSTLLPQTDAAAAASNCVRGRGCGQQPSGRVPARRPRPPTSSPGADITENAFGRAVRVAAELSDPPQADAEDSRSCEGATGDEGGAVRRRSGTCTARSRSPRTRKHRSRRRSSLIGEEASRLPKTRPSHRPLLRASGRRGASRKRTFLSASARAPRARKGRRARTGTPLRHSLRKIPR